MGCCDNGGQNSTTNIKAKAQEKPKNTKGISFGGSQISALPTPKVTVKMY